MIDAASTTAAAPGPDRVDENGDRFVDTCRATRCSVRSNIAGSTRFAMTAAGWVPVSAVSRSSSSIDSVTGISSGVVVTTHARSPRVVEDVEHPLRLFADEADLDEIGDHPRRTDLADDVTARLGVDDDEVVVALLDLPAELADREDLLDARRRVGDEVERRRQQPRVDR